MLENYLVENYNLDHLIFTKPKKYGEYMISKIRYPTEDITDDMLIQFPKMTITSKTDKNIELEFNNDTKYNTEIYNFLSKLDNFILTYINNNSKEWFGKEIPESSLKQMYNSFIKPPKTSENKCTISFDFKIKNSEIKSTFVDHKNDEINLNEIKCDQIECISHLKYIIFSKDTCFTTWDLVTAKLCAPKINKVKHYGFIETVESDSDDETTTSVFTFY